ncbi:MAG: SDR family oxidoreductase [Candidatus Kariarchaeaceae archaeon]|jgi:NAD(P)-dependent dehydrogenase (short-subunit alcohol dehydrogenase family)
MDNNGFIVITGAAGGLGMATARLLSANGKNLILTDIVSPAEFAQEIQHDRIIVEVHRLDVGNSYSVESLILEAREKGYRIDGVVNFAGITRDRTILKMSEEEWDQVINVNLKGTYNIVQAFGKLMKNTGGTIVTVGSAVSRMGNYGQVNYVAAKAGVEGLTRTAAREFAKYGIRVNCIVPGFIESPMSMAVPKERIEIIRNTIPLGRIGKAEEIADLADFLLSEKSSYITGATIQIDGGLRM